MIVANRATRIQFHRCLRRLGHDTYDAYLRSPHWVGTRQQYRDSERPQNCYCCGDWETQLHHKTYERLGAEQLDDLVPLCRRCHALVHELERRGDLTLDLAGLLDQQRASLYAQQQQPITQRAIDDSADRAKRERRRYANSLAQRIKIARTAEDVRAIVRELDDIVEALESAA